jgi:hypothetical protein
VSILGVDLGLRHERDADEFVAAVVAGDVLASTHLVAGAERRHVAVAFGVEGEAAERKLLTHLLTDLADRQQWTLVVGDEVHGTTDFLPGARQAVTEHSARSAGRLVRFAGVDALVGEVSVAEVLASAIDRVAVLADADPSGETRLVTRDFVRPRWSAGQLVLHTQPNKGGTLVPFETPNPTPCCVDHSPAVR